MLQALKIPTQVYHAGLTHKEKDELRKAFNENDKPLVMIGSYAVTSCGLNLHKRCHWGVFLDPPPSKPIGDQAGARIHRVGQDHPVQLITLTTKNSFNERQILNNLRKAIPGLLASLNQNLFGVDIIGVADKDSQLKPDLGQWVKFQGRWLPIGDPLLPIGHNLPVHEGWDFVEEVY
jgi:hypothetical protein